MQVTFWGTRGSLAKPGPSTIKYGGNTSCVEVRTSTGTLIVLDCGTGAHNLGHQLVRRAAGPTRGSLLISHTHWDHIQGIPFFAPFFVAGSEWDIYAPQGFGESLRSTLAGQMEYTYFPITEDAFAATIRHHNVSEGVFHVGDVQVRTRFMNHPALTIGYRIEADGAALVYACDHEPHSQDAAVATADLSGQDVLHAEFLKGADLVIHDAQYSADEYPAKAGWGHSTIEYAVSVCEAAGVRQLALTHHDPMRNDEAVDALLARATARVTSSGLKVFAAAEGVELEVKGDGPGAHVPHEDTALEPAAASGRSVLVITTDAALLERVRGAVQAEGLQVAPARSVEQASRLSSREVPPLIIADGRSTVTGLPPWGWQTPAVPILVVSDIAGRDARRNVEQISATFTQEYLRSRIRTWLMRGKFGGVPATIPEEEAERMATLRSVQLLDTPPEERFDRFTRLAARIFHVPISLLTLVDEDRQWFKSRMGLEIPETSRNTSFCAHAILEERPMVVPDATQDERFESNPLVTGHPRIRFYAGVPLKIRGQAIGTLCLIDTRPRTLTADELQSLDDLGALIEDELRSTT